MIDIKRTLNLSAFESSQFLFGPRMTGKTKLLRELSVGRYYDLLNNNEELRLKVDPGLLWREVQSLPSGATVVIDEIQRVPALLDYVQQAIDQKNLRFLLSGSSARKLKRGAANLLGGRAIERHLHPLTAEELGARFDLELAMSFGTLPKPYLLAQQKQAEEARAVLSTYYTIYIKEEIQAEAVTRNIPAFQRFLNVAAQSHGHVIEYQNISRDCRVPASTVKEYFSILEDTLLAGLLWPWDASERKKARPKLYLFDPGVVRAIQNRLYDPPSGQELGHLFEGWFAREVMRIRDYAKPYLQVSFWRHGNFEIDLLLQRAGRPLLAVEIKSGLGPALGLPSIKAFRSRFGETRIIVASLRDMTPRRDENGIEVLPWFDALNVIRAET